MYTIKKVVEEIQTSPNSVYTIKYEYDAMGNKIKAKSQNQKTLSTQTTTYTYNIIAKK